MPSNYVINYPSIVTGVLDMTLIAVQQSFV